MTWGPGREAKQSWFRPEYTPHMSAEAPHGNALRRWYARNIGEPDREADVYLGFGLFFAAISFAAIALLLFLVATAEHGFREPGYFPFAEPAYVLSMLSLPLALVSVVVLLPVKARVLVVAGLGVVITVVAAAGFVSVYPADWWEFGMQETIAVVGTYAVGLTLVIAATGAALVAHQLERVQPPTPAEILAAVEEREPAAPPREEVSEAQIRADIEDAMASVDLSWGGIVKEEHRRLELTADYADEYAGAVTATATTTERAGGVDDQVSQLRALKGGARTTATSASGVDEQTAALRQLRAEAERDEIPANAPVRSDGYIDRLLDRFGLR